MEHRHKSFLVVSLVSELMKCLWKLKWMAGGAFWPGQESGFVISSGVFFPLCLDIFSSSCSNKLSCWSCRCSNIFFFIVSHFFPRPETGAAEQKSETSNERFSSFCLFLSFSPVPHDWFNLINFYDPRSARALNDKNYHEPGWKGIYCSFLMFHYHAIWVCLPSE